MYSLVKTNAQYFVVILLGNVEIQSSNETPEKRVFSLVYDPTLDITSWHLNCLLSEALVVDVCANWVSANNILLFYTNRCYLILY